ncbi:7959_t:CDS:2, partial [Paraglomus occultum]
MATFSPRPSGDGYRLCRPDQNAVLIMKLPRAHLIHNIELKGNSRDAKNIFAETIRQGMKHEGLGEEAVTDLINFLWKKKAIKQEFKETANSLKTFIRTNSEASIVLDERVSARQNTLEAEVDYNGPLPPPFVRHSSVIDPSSEETI